MKTFDLTDLIPLLAAHAAPGAIGDFRPDIVGRLLRLGVVERFPSSPHGFIVTPLGFEVAESAIRVASKTYTRLSTS